MKPDSNRSKETWDFSGDKADSQNENRSLPRFRDPEFDALHIALRNEGLGRVEKVRLEDYSSFGFSVTLPVKDETDSLLQQTQWVQGIKTFLEMGWSASETFACACEIRNVRMTPTGLRLGLQRMNLELSTADWSAVSPAGKIMPAEASRRQVKRLPLGPGAPLTARINHPFLYRYACRVQAEDLNGLMGLSFVSTDPRLLLFQNQILDLHFELPGMVGFSYRGRVAWMTAFSKTGLRFGLQCLDIPMALHDGICRFLIASQRLSPHQLRELGFLPRAVKDLLRFRTVSSRDDYGRVLALRRDAYVAAGRLPPDVPIESLASPLDGRSRIILAQNRERLIGSITLTFPTLEDILDTERGFSPAKYPVAMPDKTSMVEIARLCIAPDYQDTDVLQGLFQQAIKHVLLSDREYVVTSSVKELLPFYERLGFKEVGAIYAHPLLQGRPHHLILAHREDFLLGRGMSLAAWGFFFADVAKHLVVEKKYRVPLLQGLYIRFKVKLLPWVQQRQVAKSNLQFRRHLERLRILAH